jgi:hypothetical protein
MYSIPWLRFFTSRYFQKSDKIHTVFVQLSHSLTPSRMLRIVDATKLLETRRGRRRGKMRQDAAKHKIFAQARSHDAADCRNVVELGLCLVLSPCQAQSGRVFPIESVFTTTNSAHKTNSNDQTKQKPPVLKTKYEVRSCNSFSFGHDVPSVHCCRS